MPSNPAIFALLLACVDPAPTDDKPLDTVAPQDSSDTSDTAQDQPPTWDGWQLQLGEPQPCGDPFPDARYTEVAETRGLTGPQRSDLPHGEFGGGAAVVDANGDGHMDIVMGWHQEPLVLHYREGDRYRPHPLNLRGVEAPEVPTLSLGDVNADGTLDLLLAGNAPRVLWGQDGGFVAGPEIEVFGERAGDTGQYLRELVPADLDQDGVLDLVALAPRAEALHDVTLRGDGEGGFEAIPLPGDPALSAGQGFDAVVADVNRDGWPDLYVVNDMLDGNVLWLNQEGALVGPDTHGLQGCGVVQRGMGVDVGDFNGDGHPDFFATDAGRPALLQGLPDGGCVDVTVSAGLPVRSDMGWGARWLDQDNDGQLDLAVAQGDLWVGEEGDREDLDVALLQQREGQFFDVAPAVGLPTEGSYRAVVAFHDNEDGVLDLLITEVDRAPQLFVSRGCTAPGWLAVQAPPHTRVELWADGRRQVAWTSTESGFGGAGPSVAHFGLGDAQEVERMEMTLPGGRTLTLDEVLPARRMVRLSPL